jgi:hypothetical protein
LLGFAVLMVQAIRMGSAHGQREPVGAGRGTVGGVVRWWSNSIKRGGEVATGIEHARCIKWLMAGWAISIMGWAGTAPVGSGPVHGLKSFSNNSTTPSLENTKVALPAIKKFPHYAKV